MRPVSEVADELRGTANSLEEVVGVDFDAIPRDWLTELDELVLLCALCGWWDDADNFDTDTGECICSECLE